MISFIDTPAKEKEFLVLTEGSAIGCKLQALAKAYGFHQNFIQFWSDGCAAYCLLDSELSISGRVHDPEEARAFVSMLGPEAVLCQEETAQLLGLRQRLGGPVLMKALSAGTHYPLPAWPKIDQIWELLKSSGLISSESQFEPFYLDLSHRLRHGCAIAAGEFCDERLAGCGIAAISGGGALLSALAVEESFRRKGVGSRIIRRIESALPGRRLYALRHENENQAFYRGLGFLEVGRWTQASGI